MLSHFVRSRYCLRFNSRAQLERWQQKQLQRFLREDLPRAAFYQSYKTTNIADLPMMDKAQMMADFTARNTANITVEEAMAVAENAETSRDFNPTLGTITVGMSSGTSGKRGLFLVSNSERARWAGILLAKTMPTAFIWHILQWWRPPLSIAFFLRANSNLYNTLNSRRIDFRFYDLLQGVEAQVGELNRQLPLALVAPATVLQRLAQLALSGELRIRPRHIVSVAEVLEADAAQLIEQAFGQKTHQIYQATEGFLGYTCERGNLHLNESHIYIEKEWLDESNTRFHPIITDFSRTTQLIVRYRLNDVLRLADQPCACGRVETCLAAVEGRADQILWLPGLHHSASVALYPDVLRRALMLVHPVLLEYSVAQRGMHWHIDLLCESEVEAARAAVTNELTQLCRDFGVCCPRFTFGQWQPQPLAAKRRRLWCYAKA